MHQKITSLLAAVLAVLLLCSCGGQPSQQPNLPETPEEAPYAFTLDYHRCAPLVERQIGSDLAAAARLVVDAFLAGETSVTLPEGDYSGNPGNDLGYALNSMCPVFGAVTDYDDNHFDKAARTVTWAYTQTPEQIQEALAALEQTTAAYMSVLRQGDSETARALLLYHALTEPAAYDYEMEHGDGDSTEYQFRTSSYAALVLLSFLCLFFFYVLVINSTRTHFEIQKGFSFLPGKSLMTNLKNVLSDANIPVLTGVRNSLIVSGCSAALSVYFSALTAYGIYAYNFRFKKAAFAIILLIMTMPTQVSALGFLQLITKMGLKNSFIPLIIPSIAAPAVFFFMKQYLDASLPMEIVEAARIDGAGEFYTFNHIVLPIMKPALAVQAIFSFVSSWNNYFIPALVLDTADKKTLPILIAQLRSADFLKFDMGKVYMLVAIAILPVIIVYLLLSKFIVRGVALGGVKG